MDKRREKNIGRARILLAVRAMASWAFMPGSVGGDPIILVIEANGTGHAFGLADIPLMESCLKAFEYNATSLSCASSILR